MPTDQMGTEGSFESMSEMEKFLCEQILDQCQSSNRLRDFSQKGEVTDAELMRTKDGKSRQFAFIGFRSDHDAKDALNYFNNSYLDTSRITCELARKVGDPTIPRPWSRHSSKKPDPPPKAAKQKSSRVTLDNDDVETVDDPQLNEFLEIMQPRANSKKVGQ